MNSARIALMLGAVLTTEVIRTNREAILLQVKRLRNWAKRQFSRQAPAVQEVPIRGPDEELEAILCPISQEIMQDPVQTPYGHCFDRVNIESWIYRSQSCPITRKRLRLKDLKPCRAMRLVVELYLKQHSEQK
jgi:hypothetical protein